MGHYSGSHDKKGDDFNKRNVFILLKEREYKQVC